jgi:hypothetical protein
LDRRASERQRGDAAQDEWPMSALSGDLARALDPCLLASDLGFVLDDWQSRLLAERPRRALLCCSRQSGKTLITCLMAIWQAVYEPGLILILSPSLRQSTEALRVLLGLYARLKGVPELKQENLTRCELANGARVISLPGQERTIRGYSKADLIIIDEAARVPDELMVACRPMQAVAKGGGRLVALSTPAGRRGWFFEQWSNGDAVWDRTRVSADMCPRITPEFLAEELKALGPQKFSEEYDLEFIDATESVFPETLVSAAFSHEVQVLWPMN